MERVKKKVLFGQRCFCLIVMLDKNVKVRSRHNMQGL